MVAWFDAQRLNSIGLVFGMVGVLMLFRWRPPRPDFADRVPSALEHNTLLPNGSRVKDYLAGIRRKKKHYTCMSRIGLGPIGVGFSFQLLGHLGELICALQCSSSVHATDEFFQWDRLFASAGLLIGTALPRGGFLPMPRAIGRNVNDRLAF